MRYTGVFVGKCHATNNTLSTGLLLISLFFADGYRQQSRGTHALDLLKVDTENWVPGVGLVKEWMKKDVKRFPRAKLRKAVHEALEF